MASHPAEQYLDCLNKLDAAKRQIDELSSYLLEVSTALRKDPLGFVVSGLGVAPAVPLAGCSYDLDAGTWPDAKRIAQKVLALQEAYFTAEYAWFHLPSGLRSGLPRFKVR